MTDQNGVQRLDADEFTEALLEAMSLPVAESEPSHNSCGLHITMENDVRES